MEVVSYRLPANWRKKKKITLAFYRRNFLPYIKLSSKQTGALLQTITLMPPNPSVSLEGLLISGVCFASPCMPAVCPHAGWWWPLAGAPGMGTGGSGHGGRRLNPSLAGRGRGDAGSCPWGEKSTKRVGACPRKLGRELGRARASRITKPLGDAHQKPFAASAAEICGARCTPGLFSPLLGLKYYNTKREKCRNLPLGFALTHGCILLLKCGGEWENKSPLISEG